MQIQYQDEKIHNFDKCFRNGRAYVLNIGELLLDDQVSPPKITREIKLADEFNY